jgi:hypothetical protein
MESSPTMFQQQGVPLHNFDSPTYQSKSMDVTLSENPEQAQSALGSTLQVDFKISKWKAIVTTKDDPTATPVYIVDFKTFKPHLVFKSMADNTDFATGTLHPVSINADCVVRGNAIQLKAMKRFKIEYEHLSYAYSDTSDPVAMTWHSACGWKTWDFVCTDAQQNPVARFSANAFSFVKVGDIEFVGPKANDTAARDEILATGLTLFYCIVLRSSSIVSFFGALFASPGHAQDKNK